MQEVLRTDLWHKSLKEKFCRFRMKRFPSAARLHASQCEHFYSGDTFVKEIGQKMKDRYLIVKVRGVDVHDLLINRC